MAPLIMAVAAIAALCALYVVLLVMADVYLRFRTFRTVVCPETGLREEVQLDAWHAAATAVPGPPDVYIASCTAWPGRAGCERRCGPRVAA
jgi:hypothetical protein